MESYLSDKTEIIQKTIELSNIENDINNIIKKINDESDYYLDYEKIKNDFNIMIKELIINNSLEFKNRCVECGIDMGKDNPRQLCGKTKCSYN
jgi:hypothetical protein